MKFLLLSTITCLLTVTKLHAGWDSYGEKNCVQISGNRVDLSCAVTVDVPTPAVAAAARFGPIPIDTAARGYNLRAEIDPTTAKGANFRLTAVITTDTTFPAVSAKPIARTNRTITHADKGMAWIHVAMPKEKSAGNTYNLFIEIANDTLEKTGNPGRPVAGRVTLRGLDVRSSILPASTNTEQRRAAFLDFQGRHTLADSLGKVSTKSALRLPGLLAAITTVTSVDDPRLTRYLEDSLHIVKGMRGNALRLGPFEIYFPIANYVAGKNLLGPILTQHPRFAEYEKAVFEFQCTWPDYKSNADGWPKRPIREAKTLADVPESIDTGNFRLLVTAAGYLAAQEFPEFKTTLTNPKSGAQTSLSRDTIQREMALYIRRVYHSIASTNTWEYGSQTYLAIDFAPIHMIAQWAKDPEIRRIASATLDCLYSSLACSLNQGHYIHSAGRSKGEFLGTGSGMGFLGWMMFGTEQTRDALTTPFLVYAALPGAYQVPKAIRPPHTFPFVKREKIGDGQNFVGTYTYQTKSFGLASAIESRNPESRSKPKWDNDGYYKEAGRHKLNWIADLPGGFVPQWQNSAQPYAGRRNQANGNYYGLNPWSQVIQHEGTQIGLADVPESYPFRQLFTIYTGNGSIRKRIFHPQTGWMVCHTGATLFGFRSLKPATRSGEAWPDKLSVTERFDYKKTAWILEAFDAPSSTSAKSDRVLAEEIAQFHSLLQKATVTATHLDDADQTPPTLEYTSPISEQTLRLDASVYPIQKDGSGMPLQDYPVLATESKHKPFSLVRQNRHELVWLDQNNHPVLKHDFASWLK